MEVVDKDGFWLPPPALDDDTRRTANEAVAMAILQDTMRLKDLRKAQERALMAYRNRSWLKRLSDWCRLFWWRLFG